MIQIALEGLDYWLEAHDLAVLVIIACLALVGFIATHFTPPSNRKD